LYLLLSFYTPGSTCLIFRGILIYISEYIVIIRESLQKRECSLSTHSSNWLVEMIRNHDIGGLPVCIACFDRMDSCHFNAYLKTIDDLLDSKYRRVMGMVRYLVTCEPIAETCRIHIALHAGIFFELPANPGCSNIQNRDRVTVY